MAKIACIGKEPILQGLTYVGVTVFLVASAQEAEARLQTLLAEPAEKWGLIYVEERLAEAFIDRLKALNTRPLPVVSLLPTIGVKKNITSQALQQLVRKVTGVDLQFD